jgi:hypothetical protein
MKTNWALLLAWPLLVGPAMAAPPGECLLARHQLEHEVPLPNAQRAIAAGKLTVLVLGSGSSILPGPKGAELAYPARLQNALRELLPGVAVKVVADVKPRRPAGETVKALGKELAEVKPALIIWQTGTVEAMQGVDPEQFSQALDRGINIAHGAGADVVLVNAQYSPRTESMIGLSAYTEIMRWVALQHDTPLFNRFEIMKSWADLGTFDFMGAANKLEVAARVHDCIGWLLADLVVETVKHGGPQTEGR